VPEFSGCEAHAYPACLDTASCMLLYY
jgi:hypothetical protein